MELGSATWNTDAVVRDVLCHEGQIQSNCTFVVVDPSTSDHSSISGHDGRIESERAGLVVESRSDSVLVATYCRRIQDNETAAVVDSTTAGTPAVPAQCRGVHRDGAKICNAAPVESGRVVAHDGGILHDRRTSIADPSADEAGTITRYG